MTQTTEAAAYERTNDWSAHTTRRVLTVGRSTMVHALDEDSDIWGICHGRVGEGQTYAQALCGQRSPVMNRNRGSRMADAPVAVECKKCIKVMDNVAAKEAAE